MTPTPNHLLGRDLAVKLRDDLMRDILHKMQLVDDDPDVVLPMMFYLAMDLVRTVNKTIASEVPEMAVFTEAQQMTLLGTFLARCVSSDEYERMRGIPEHVIAHASLALSKKVALSLALAEQAA